MTLPTTSPAKPKAVDMTSAVTPHLRGRGGGGKKPFQFFIGRISAICLIYKPTQ